MSSSRNKCVMVPVFRCTSSDDPFMCMFSNPVGERRICSHQKKWTHDIFMCENRDAKLSALILYKGKMNR